MLLVSLGYNIEGTNTNCKFKGKRDRIHNLIVQQNKKTFLSVRKFKLL